MHHCEDIMRSRTNVLKKSARFIISQMLLLFLIPTLCSFWPFTNDGRTTLLRINTTETTNQGVPFYLYIKEVEKGEFLKHEYQHIVHEAFPFSDKTPDIQPYVIFPGKNYDIRVPREQKEKPLGIYVLYTNPGDDWKLLANGSNRITVILGDTEILSAYIK